MHRCRRIVRLALLHALTQLATGEVWYGLAAAAIAGLAAIPAETLSAHSWLRTATPIALALIGCAAKGLQNHPAVCAHCHDCQEGAPS